MLILTRHVHILLCFLLLQLLKAEEDAPMAAAEQEAGGAGGADAGGAAGGEAAGGAEGAAPMDVES